MKIGVFGIIPWSFLDQRPQVFAKKLAEWGYEVIYFEAFAKFQPGSDVSLHPWDEYKKVSWEYRVVGENLTVVDPLMIPAHKRFKEAFYKNKEFIKENIVKIKEMNLDLAVVIDPQWGRILHEINIPYIYDHVDDTHHMAHVIEDFFYEEQIYSDDHSLFNIYIQPNIARRYKGLYIPNGITISDLISDNSIEKEYDAACLSCIADWFDIKSVLNTKKRILLIGPMDVSIKEKYTQYREGGGRNVNWIPGVPRRMGTLWLNKADVGIIPFDESHGIVDYVMPLKIVEYFYLGMPCVCYVNKGVMEEFGDHVFPYSASNWLGYPSLDDAIEKAQQDKRNAERTAIAKNYTWDHVMFPLKQVLQKMDDTFQKTGKIECKKEIFQN